MKITLVLFIVVVVGIAVVYRPMFTRNSNVSTVVEELDKEIKMTAPDSTENLKRKIEEANAQFKETLVPLLKKMPAELKRAEALIRANEELLKQLPKVETVN